jgi:acetoacetyl-CoA synthetase
VKLAGSVVLSQQLVTTIKSTIRQGCSPRHVPAVILTVPDVPRTRSGKLAELAVRDVVEGRAVRNTEALANPECLGDFANRAELA